METRWQNGLADYFVFMEIFRNDDRVPSDSRWRFLAGRFTVVFAPFPQVRSSFGDQFLRSLLAPTISDNIIIRQGKFSSESRGRFNLPMREAINAGSASAHRRIPRAFAPRKHLLIRWNSPDKTFRHTVWSLHVYNTILFALTRY